MRRYGNDKETLYHCSGGTVNLVFSQYDRIFFLIYLAAVILFIAKEKIGKWAMIIWTAMWFVTQLGGNCHKTLIY